MIETLITIARITDRRRARVDDACLFFASVIGVGIMACWLAQPSLLTRLFFNSVPMVLGTATGVTFAALAGLMAPGPRLLSLPVAADGLFKLISAVLGALILALALANLVEILGGVDLGIDRASLHRPLQPDNAHPGRMAPETAVALALIGLVLAAQSFISGSQGGRRLLIMSRLAAAIGVYGLFLYPLKLEFLYGFSGVTRMSWLTAICLILIAIGLTGRLNRRLNSTIDGEKVDADDLLNSASLVLLVIVITAGLGCFSLMEEQLENSALSNMQNVLKSRQTFFLSVIDESAADALAVSRTQELLGYLRTLARNAPGSPQYAQALQSLRDAAAALASENYTRVAFATATAVKVEAGPEPAPTRFGLPIDSRYDERLEWESGYLLHMRLPIADKEGVVGSVELDQRLPALDGLAAEAQSWGQTGDMGLCRATPPMISCFPQRARTKPYEIAPTWRNVMVPVARALQGETGALTGLDSRGVRVVSAYAPLGDTGMAMTAKMEVAEVYTPIRRQFEHMLPYLGLLALGGVWLIRRSLRPLVDGLIQSRSKARVLADEYELISSNATDMIVRMSMDGLHQFVSPACRRLLGVEPEALLGKHPRDAVHPDDTAYIRDTFAQLAQGLDRVTVTCRAHHGAGHWVWVEVNLSVVRHPWSGKALEIVGSLRDITQRHEIQLAVAKSEARFVAATNASLDAFFILESVRDSKGEIVDFRFDFANALARKITRFTAEQLKGQLLGEILPMSYSNGFFERFKQVAVTGISYTDEYSTNTPGGGMRRINHQVVKLGDGVAITSRDVTEQHRQQAALCESELRFTTAMNNSHDAFAICQAVLGPTGEVTDFRYSYMNKSALEMMGKPGDTPVSELDTMFAMEVGYQTTLAEYSAVFNTGVTLTTERRVSYPGSVTRWVEMQVVKLEDGIAITARDITEKKLVHAQLQHQAHYDTLTGLPNRALFRDRLDQALRRAARGRRGFAIMLIDVDRFKHINDTYGHAAGDFALCQVARHLQGIIRKTDTAARLGGDEFTIIMELADKVSDLRRVAEKMLEFSQLSHWFDKRAFRISLSVGLTFLEGDGSTADAVLHAADTAMYEMKKNGRNDLYDLYLYPTLDPSTAVPPATENKDPGASGDAKPKVVNLDRWRGD